MATGLSASCRRAAYPAPEPRPRATHRIPKAASRGLFHASACRTAGCRPIAIGRCCGLAPPGNCHASHDSCHPCRLDRRDLDDTCAPVLRHITVPTATRHTVRQGNRPRTVGRIRINRQTDLGSLQLGISRLRRQLGRIPHLPTPPRGRGDLGRCIHCHRRDLDRIAVPASDMDDGRRHRAADPGGLVGDTHRPIAATSLTFPSKPSKRPSTCRQPC